jgi:hypothetical protein
MRHMEHDLSVRREQFGMREGERIESQTKAAEASAT